MESETMIVVKFMLVALTIIICGGFLFSVFYVVGNLMAEQVVPRLDAFLRKVFEHQHNHKFVRKMKVYSEYKCKCGDVIYKAEKK